MRMHALVPLQLHAVALYKFEVLANVIMMFMKSTTLIYVEFKHAQLQQYMAKTGVIKRYG